MTRFLLAAAAAIALVPAARAHFVFLIPSADGKTVTVVMSEYLAPDDNVTVDKIAGLKPTVRDAAGKDVAVELKAEKHELNGSLPGSGPRVVFGSVNYGVMTQGAKPYFLAYYPKAVVGPVAEDKAVLGDKVPAELVFQTRDGVSRLRFLAAGKPVEGAEITLIKPDGKSEKIKTAKDGRTDPITGTGRFGAWAKTIEAKSGDLDGKKYDEARHYATLVFEATQPAPATEKAAVPSPYPPLPVGVSSLGAIALDGYLYVYGGHSGKTHSYDTTSIQGTFRRLKLDGGTKWENLPGGPGLQGMNLAAHGGKVYRVGGMQPRNAPGEPGDMHSVATVSRFDPATGVWSDAPSLPAGRSSHDVVAVGDKLVVVGGWNQRGKESSVWHETTLVLDLSAKEPKWKEVPQPFQRRALTAAAAGGKVYVLAGMDRDGGMDKTVNVFDVASETWSTGPDLPGGDRSAFSPAATTLDGRVVVNTSSGPVFRLTADGTAWEKIGASSTNRMVARLIPIGSDSVALVGGASQGGNAAVVEVIKLATKGEKVATGEK